MTEEEIWLHHLGPAFQRCEDSAVGHVFKSMTGAGKGAGVDGQDVMVICPCGYRMNCKLCIRCGYPLTSDPGIDAAHSR